MDTTTSAVESIANLIQCKIPRAPPVVPTNDPTPTPEQKIHVPDQIQMNVPTVSSTMPLITVKVQRLPIVSPSMPPVQVKRVPHKYPGWKQLSLEEFIGSATCLP